MTAMPSLQGSVGYIFTSCDLNVKSSEDVGFKDMIDRFRVYDQPRRPEPKEEEWLAGERVDKRGASRDMQMFIVLHWTRPFRLSPLWASLPSYWPT